jgi:ankyrin repeat protein
MMAHQAGWVELYNVLEAGRHPTPDLVKHCKDSRTSIGETMLHWYAIEGAPNVLARLIELGFSVNVQNEFGRTPLMECSLIGRWDNARVLIEGGADLSLVDNDGMDYFEVMDEYSINVPDWVPRSV